MSPDPWRPVVPWRRPSPPSSSLAGPQILDRLIPLEEIEQDPKRLAAHVIQAGIALQDEPGVVSRHCQQLAMHRNIRGTKLGKAALPRAQKLAGTT